MIVLFRFQPSYEGLKLPTVKFVHKLLCFISFQPSYEGLKLTQSTSVRNIVKSFQPSYEGLKPKALAVPYVEAVFVFSLPMRD